LDRNAWINANGGNVLRTIGGAIDVAFGVVMALGTGGLAWAPAVGLITLGMDQIVTAGSNMLTGVQGPSVIEFGVARAAAALGASEQTAEIIGAFAPAALSMLLGSRWVYGWTQSVSFGNVVGRGQPFAFGGLSRDARAGRLLYEAARTSGHGHFRHLVDRVLYSATESFPFFTVNPNSGLRTIVIDAATFGRTRAGQLIIGVHELVHAEQWAAHLASHGGNLAAAHASFFVRARTLQ
jgi:hypothetical protein